MEQTHAAPKPTPRPNLRAYGELVTAEELAKILGISARKLEVDRYRGSGPPYVKLGARCIRYLVEDVERWLREQRRTSTAGEGGR